MSHTRARNRSSREKHKFLTAVALANKMARMIRAMTTKEEDYLTA